MDAALSLPQEAIIVARERLRLLALAFYISGAIGAVFASFFLIYAVMFGVMSFIPDTQRSHPAASASKYSTNEDVDSAPSRVREVSPSPAVFLRVFAAIMGVIVILGWLFSGLTIYAGRCLQQRKNLSLIYVMAGLNTIWIPYGTILGVVTFLALGSEAAKSLFQSDSGTALSS